MKTPCEVIVWNVVPIIRKEFAKSLIKNHNFTQREVADKLGITEAAVSRYISGKRGAIEITDNGILKEIERSTERIAKKSSSCTVKEICKICRLLQSRDIVGDVNYICKQ